MFNWYATGQDVDRLIAKAKYLKAIKLLRQMLKEQPRDTHLRKKLADVLALAGNRQEAAAILEGMVSEFADDGFLTKAIAVVKKIQRIDPERGDLDGKLASLVQQRDKGESRAARKPSHTGSIQQPREKAPMEAVLNSPLFTGCSTSGLQAFIQGLNLLTFQPGEIVISEGEPGSSLLVLASGRVRVYVRAETGRNNYLRALEAGDFFGEISILTGRARTATVTAAEPCEILELGQNTLEELGRQYPGVSQVIRDACESRAQSPEELEARRELQLPL